MMETQPAEISACEIGVFVREFYGVPTGSKVGNLGRIKNNVNQRTTKTTIRPVRPAKTQISLYIHPVWQEFSFISLWIARRL